METRPHIYIARYQKTHNTTVEGVAKTGEISPQGTVTHIEDREGRVQGIAAPSTIRYIRLPDGTIRRKTMKEMIADGQFIIGVGPGQVKER